MSESQNKNRRNFLKKAAYVAPAIVTLSALPSIAQSASSGDNVSYGGGHHGHTGGDRPRHFFRNWFHR